MMKRDGNFDNKKFLETFKSKGYSKKDFSKRSGIHISTVEKLFKEENSNMEINTLRKIEIELGFEKGGLLI